MAIYIDSSTGKMSTSQKKGMVSLDTYTPGKTSGTSVVKKVSAIIDRQPNNTQPTAQPAPVPAPVTPPVPITVADVKNAPVANISKQQKDLQGIQTALEDTSIYQKKATLNLKVWRK